MAEPPDQEATEDFHFGAAVYTVDAIEIGTLHRVIVDGTLGAAHSLIVSEKSDFAGHSGDPNTVRLFPDVIVPTHFVTHAMRTRIDLSINVAGVRDLRPYIHREWTPATRFQAALQALAPLTGVAVIPGTVTFGKADLDLEIEQGENVMIGHHGDKLGTVRDVTTVDREVAGVVVRPHGLFTHDVLLPIRVFGRSDDLALFIRVSREDLLSVTTPVEPTA